MRPNWRGDLPLWNSASGQAFAAYLPPEKLISLLDAEFAAQKRAEKLGAVEIQRRRRAYDRHLADVRKHGLARITGERYPGLNAFASPIFDRDEQVVLAVTSFGLATTFSPAWEGRIPRALRLFAEELTSRIAGRRPQEVPTQSREAT
jgi:DNA-binding IclR family transcriptional regulator